MDNNNRVVQQSEQPIAKSEAIGSKLEMLEKLSEEEIRETVQLKYKPGPKSMKHYLLESLEVTPPNEKRRKVNTPSSSSNNDKLVISAKSLRAADLKKLVDQMKRIDPENCPSSRTDDNSEFSRTTKKDLLIQAFELTSTGEAAAENTESASINPQRRWTRSLAKTTVDSSRRIKQNHTHSLRSRKVQATITSEEKNSLKHQMQSESKMKEIIDSDDQDDSRSKAHRKEAHHSEKVGDCVCLRKSSTINEFCDNFIKCPCDQSFWRSWIERKKRNQSSRVPNRATETTTSAAKRSCLKPENNAGEDSTDECTILASVGLAPTKKRRFTVNLD